MASDRFQPAKAGAAGRGSRTRGSELSRDVGGGEDPAGRRPPSCETRRAPRARRRRAGKRGRSRRPRRIDPRGGHPGRPIRPEGFRATPAFSRRRRRGSGARHRRERRHLLGRRRGAPAAASLSRPGLDCRPAAPRREPRGAGELPRLAGAESLLRDHGCGGVVDAEPRGRRPPRNHRRAAHHAGDPASPRGLSRAGPRLRSGGRRPRTRSRSRSRARSLEAPLRKRPGGPRKIDPLERRAVRGGRRHASAIPVRAVLGDEGPALGTSGDRNAVREPRRQQPPPLRPPEARRFDRPSEDGDGGDHGAPRAGVPGDESRRSSRFAEGSGRRPGAAGSSRPFRRGRVRAADRLRQRRAHAARPRGRAAQGGRPEARARRRTGTPGSPVPDRERRSLGSRRRGRSATGRLGDSRSRRREPGRNSGRRKRGRRREGRGLSRDRLDRHGAALWPRPGAARESRRSRGLPAGTGNAALRRACRAPVFAAS